MWFGGPGGLYRFDGVRFESVKIDSGNANRGIAITELYGTPGGELIIGKNKGGISILKAGKLTHFDDKEVLGVGSITTFATDGEGNLWCSATGGVLRFDGFRWTSIGPEWGYPGGGAGGMALDSHGTLWISTEKNILRLPKGGRRLEIAPVKLKGGQQPEQGGPDMIYSPDGSIFMVDPMTINLLAASDNKGNRPVQSFSHAILFDAHGNLWSVYPKALESWRGSKVVDLNSLGTDITTGYSDPDGTMWLVTMGSRVIRFRQPAVHRVGLKKQRAFVTFATDKSGKIWICVADSYESGSDGLWTFDVSTRHVQAKEIRSASAIGRDREGNVWVGGPGGLWRQHADRFESAGTLPAAAQGARVKGVSPDCAGGLWVTMEGVGLFKKEEGQWLPRSNVDGLPAEAPSAQACDSARRLWLGYSDGTIVRIAQDGHVTFDVSRGLQVGAITSFGLGPAHTLVAGERGLAILKGTSFVTVSAHDPLALDQLTGIAEEADGDVWVAGGHGAARIARSDLDSLAPTSNKATISAERFDMSDGYPGAGYSRVLSAPSVAVAGDGKVWVVGGDDVAWIDSKVIPRSTAPPLMIEALSAEGNHYDPRDRIDLRQGTRRVEIDYTALDYSHPDRLRFRYRLDGVDSDWVPVDARRQAFYTNLGPGKYRFRVNVTDERGAWTDRTAALGFVIPPTFIQSRFFLLLCIAGALALGAVVYRLRIHQLKLRQRRLLEERFSERERIARELHDTLLQGTQALILDIHRAATLVSRGERPQQLLEDAMSRGDNAVAEGRSRIEALRSNDETGVDFERLLKEFGEEQALGSAVRFSASTDGTSRPMLPAASHETYSIGREALLNAFRHAHANSVELHLAYGRREFRLCIKDDGTGIDPRVLQSGARAGHWGLPGMQERAKSIGGTLDIRSGSGAGTELELVIQAENAYAQAARPRWLRLLTRTE